MSDPIDRLNAALEGRYRIERELGEGGMATVYLARDERHNRNVALKVLKPELAAVVGAERFLAEIETTANLQHPHILPLFDSGEADGFLFYVMPYVEGESLRARLDRERQLPVDEAVRIATNMAEALDYAHRQGVIHRDIKPANVLLLEGKPVISDFGIALAVGAAGGGRLTETGLSLGTPHYMSPEQASGDDHIGPTTDVYALGCVLYEMLAGEPPHVGSTPQAVLGRIITSDPDLITTHRKTVPANVAAAVSVALEKIPADRFSGANAFAKALGDPAFSRGPTAEAVDGGSRVWSRTSSGMAILAMAATGFAAWSWLRPAAPHPVARFALQHAPGQRPLAPMSLMPDGSGIVYTAARPDGFGSQLWVRRWESLEPVPIPRTEGARVGSLGQITLSPGGTEVAFTLGAPGALRVVSLQGGVDRTVVEAAHAAGDWSEDGWIYFQTGGSAIRRVPEVGGEEEVLTERTEGEIFHALPQILPGGRKLLFQVYRDQGGQNSEIWALDIETRERELVVRGSSPSYIGTGHLLFGTNDGTLMAAPFDASTARLTGAALVVAQGLATAADRGHVRYSVSESGTLLYEMGSARAGGTQRLLVVDLEGNETALPLPDMRFGEIAWSPDGGSIVYSRAVDGADHQIHTYDVVRGTAPRRITFEGNNGRPVFSPSGDRVAFTSSRDGTQAFDLWVKDLGDDSPARPLLSLPGGEFTTDWPLDSLILFEHGPPNPSNLWTLDLSDPENPRAAAYLELDGDLDDAVLSPDGRLVAYGSDETGFDEVYVRGFPTPGERTPVSQGGGQYPFWSPDGRTIYYWAQPLPEGVTLMAARLQRDPTAVVLSRDSLFTGQYVHALSDLHPDGARIVVPQFVGSTSDETGHWVVVLNFFDELERLVPR